MLVRYQLSGVQYSFAVPDGSDLARLSEVIEQALRAKHVALTAHQGLAERITSGLHNAFATDQPEIILGELGQAA